MRDMSGRMGDRDRPLCRVPALCWGPTRTPRHDLGLAVHHR